MGGSASVHQDEWDRLHMEGKNGAIRQLPTDLYDHLSEQSDAYSSNKNYIGYVDPDNGVVLVDSTKLVEEFNSQEVDPTKSANNESIEPMDIPGSVKSTSHNSLNELCDAGEILKPFEKKTMHQLAYEHINEMPLPTDESRPISGFAVKKGKLVCNSTTFNAFIDDFHSADRQMSEFEMSKLSLLVGKLNRQEYDRKYNLYRKS